jgi:S-formylglutathione hydrolase
MIETRERHRCHGGELGFYAHDSVQTGARMRFGVFVPGGASADQPLPALYCLAGLTCTEETFLIKSGALRAAARLGLVLVACDTSPRGLGLPGEAEHWDFGVGAGFYLDATQPPWADHYRMGSYVDDELPTLIEQHFPVRPGVRGILGHSMGGHGALVLAQRDPSRWHSVSAFAPISHPASVPWGEKAFSHYLGDDRSRWADWDASALMRRQPYPGPVLVHQGLDDQFLDSQLHPQELEAAAAASGQVLTLERCAGYDHSYWFIQSFVEQHLEHHARELAAAAMR